jgi:hypothetical protein
MTVRLSALFGLIVSLWFASCPAQAQKSGKPSRKRRSVCVGSVLSMFPAITVGGQDGVAVGLGVGVGVPPPPVQLPLTLNT